MIKFTQVNLLLPLLVLLLICTCICHPQDTVPRNHTRPKTPTPKPPTRPTQTVPPLPTPDVEEPEEPEEESGDEGIVKQQPVGPAVIPPEEASAETPEVPAALGNDTVEQNSLIKSLTRGLGTVVSIEKKENNEHVCAGIILSEYIIMSSFNCLQPVKSVSNSLQIRVGSLKAGEGGYLYNVYQSYGVDLTKSKPVPVEETWGGQRRTSSKHRNFRFYKTVSNSCDSNSEGNQRKEAKAGQVVVEVGKNSINNPKVCQKAMPIEAYQSIKELFEAERYLGSINPEILFLLTCEPIIRRPTVQQASLTFYKGPFRSGSAFIVSFSKKTRELRKTLITQVDSRRCMDDFKGEYQGYKSGPTLENRFDCITDQLKGLPSARDGGYCDSMPGSPTFIIHNGKYQVNGVTIYARDCKHYDENPVVLRVFDRQIARTLSQVIYD